MLLQFAQKAFIIHDGHLLMVQKSESDPRNPGFWEVPGGRGHGEEDIDTHICREVWEEVGIRIDPGPPFDVWKWWMSDPVTGERTAFVAVARTCRPTTLGLSAEHRVPGDHLAGATWVPLSQVWHYPVIPDMRRVFRNFLTQVCPGPVAVGRFTSPWPQP
jgi:8-oxo-dGTP pyrophosphatase MutT (NUDIX family)